MSNRTRRVALDQSNTNAWTVSDSFVDLTNTPYFVIPGINVTIDIGGNDATFSTITVWAAGIVSLGDVTQEQIDFMALELDVYPDPVQGNPGFPGVFFAVAYVDNTAASRIPNFDYAYGLTDFPDPAGQLDYVPAAFVAFGFSQDASVPQIIFGTDGFTIFNQALAPVTIGYSIGGAVTRTDADTIDFDEYPDFLTQNGSSGADTLNGTAFGDNLIGNGGSDILNGFDGNDLLAGGAGADQLNGGAGFDRVDYSLSLAAITINLATGVSSSGDAAGDTLSGIEAITGSAFDDTLTGGALSDDLTGGNGNDLIDGGNGADFLVGDAGADTLLGSGGSDTLIGGPGADVLDGGSETDIAVYFTSQQGVMVDLTAATASGGDAQGDTITGIENLAGSQFADLLTGDASNNELIGEAGDDILSGMGGNDFLIGGIGRDTLNGGIGNDSLFGNSEDDVLIGGAGSDAMNGGSGNDTASYLSSNAAVSINLLTNVFSGGHALGDTMTNIESVEGSGFADTIVGNNLNNVIEGGAGADMLNGGNGTNTLSYRLSNAAVNINLLTGAVSGGHAAGDIISNFEWITGSTLGDQLTGNNVANTIAGEDGDDIINGLGGADTLQGDIGNDSIFGGDGGDLLFGGNGRDILEGGNDGDVLDGGADDDTLRGGAGGDTLTGGTGADRLEGGDNVGGTDRASYISSGVAVVVSLATGLGSAGDAAGDVLIGIEDLEGSNFNDQLTGDGNVNVLFGQGGNDLLFGGGGNDLLVGGLGDDVMDGGSGNDVMFVDAVGDVAVERAGEGSDRVASSVTYALAADAEVETLETDSLSGTVGIDLTGSDFANTLAGNMGANILRGYGGNDVLHGYGGDDFLDGGSGDDVMYGGVGNDTYYVDSADDRINELAGEGNDRVALGISYTLPDNAEIELVEAINLTSTDALNLGGSDFANTVAGNMGANILRGYGGNDVLHGYGGDDFLDGGSGDDVMYGGVGNDTYYVNSADDRINELAGEGNDRVALGISYTLPDNAEIELVEAINLTSTDALNLGGSDFANTVAGNMGANILRGYGSNDVLHGYGGDDFLDGGSGDDVMYGGVGNDTYYVDAAGDLVLEAAGEGNDRVSTSVSYALAAGAEVETLEASSLGSTDALNLTGGTSANRIIGNSGDNVLDGKGGNDVLIGAAGADTFVFSTAPGSGNIDRIGDFQSGTDKIALDRSIFSAVQDGALAAGAFVKGTAAQDGDDRIIYNEATGALLYDHDGTGPQAPFQFASLQPGVSLTGSDFTLTGATITATTTAFGSSTQMEVTSQYNSAEMILWSDGGADLSGSYDPGAAAYADHFLMYQPSEWFSYMPDNGNMLI